LAALAPTHCAILGRCVRQSSRCAARSPSSRDCRLRYPCWLLAGRKGGIWPTRTSRQDLGAGTAARASAGRPDLARCPRVARVEHRRPALGVGALTCGTALAIQDAPGFHQVERIVRLHTGRLAHLFSCEAGECRNGQPAGPAPVDRQAVEPRPAAESPARRSGRAAEGTGSSHWHPRQREGWRREISTGA